MHTLRSKLLITLALLCALVLGSSAAIAAPFQLGFARTDDVAINQPGSTPNTGEPDVGQGPQVSPTRLNVVQTRRGETPVVSSTRASSSLADMLRWARVIWLARLLGLTP